MAILNQKKILNVIPGITPQLTVHCSQSDEGSTVEFELYAGNVPFEPDGTASVQGIRKDGTGFGPEVVALDGSTATVTLSTAMTGAAGPALCEITITETGGSVSTANFALLVEEAAFPNGPLIENSVDVYQQILQYVQSFPASAAADATAKVAAEAALRQAADQALQASIDAEATARAAAVSAEATARAAADTQLQTEISGLQNAVGGPNVALTAADFTDITKVYVVAGTIPGMTTGDWYYWNGTQWVSGGVYNSMAVQTDPTLSVAGMPADAAACGDLKSAFNTISEETGNLSGWSTAPSLYPVYHGITCEVQKDGSIKLNGTASDTSRFPLKEGTVANTAWLATGTYSFGIERISGEISSTANSAFSIRTGDGTDVTASLRAPKAEGVIFAEPSVCFIYTGSGTVFTNFVFRITINNGNTLMNYAPNLTGYDYIARENSRITASKFKGIYDPITYPVNIGNAAYRSQGGCLYGDEFVWLLYISNGSVVKHGINVKTGVHTGGTISVGSDVLGHCQDITYNPNDECFYVATLLANGPIVKLNSNYEYVATITPLNENDEAIICSGVAYDRKNNNFIVAGNEDFNFYVYTNEWVYVKTITPQTESEAVVRQGIDTDGTYIYRTRTTAGGATAPKIRSYSLYGDYLGEQSIYELYGTEIEGISYDWTNKIYYINVNSKNENRTTIYLVTPNDLNVLGINLILHILNDRVAEI